MKLSSRRTVCGEDKVSARLRQVGLQRHVAQPGQRLARQNLGAFRNHHVFYYSRHFGANDGLAYRFERKFARGGLMPQRQKQKNQDDAGAQQWPMGHQPSAGAVFFVEIHEFHKVHQQTNTRTKDQQRNSILWNKSPFGTEITRHIPGEARDNRQHQIAVRA